MAERRMFAKAIVLSDAFLDMPMSARCLYFTLGMVADDDGFLNSTKSIIRQCGARESDLKILLENEFLVKFDSGVVAIKDWKVNNLIRKDRYRPTVLAPEKVQFCEGESENQMESDGLPNSNRRLTNGKPSVNQMATKGQPMVNRRLTQVRIGKESIVQDNTPPYNPPSRGAADEVEEERKEKKRKILPPDIPESIRGAWDAFAEMRRRIGKPMTDYAKHLAYRELCKLSTDPEMQVKILDQSTLNGWQGVFALKEETANTAKPAASQKASGFGNFDPLQAFQNALSRSLGSAPKEGSVKA